jgi:hypothetical protein
MNTCMALGGRGLDEVKLLKLIHDRLEWRYSTMKLLKFRINSPPQLGPSPWENYKS